MRKIYLKNQLKELKEYPIEVIDSISETIEILDDNYGANRDIYNDLGEYVLIEENIADIEILKQYKLQGLIPEYTDIIECSEGVNWTSSLFLLSSDFSIVVVITEELSKFLLE
ncbi:hypothetical protein PMY38_05730 [Clostridium tertium]|jgi:hypothetical protein|uniref:hypothetical protein n=1 Tax=Clostridium TaxID=1485 RepID=UPI000DCFC013|nr:MULTISPECIES: hypothetical protein [Clostridium]MBS5886808.1 hypothetical protein [Clostridium sp.]MDB1934862.1 hypothetical protein [Clostridium tertium]MDB1938608.1 hypothetical protein [Clostridium tertium]MDB1956243.1 hypothetical protein [Clostridium tertium]MDB1958094.1 hypothetical protein [Clostridium tertium]